MVEYSHLPQALGHPLQEVVLASPPFAGHHREPQRALPLELHNTALAPEPLHRDVRVAERPHSQKDVAIPSVEGPHGEVVGRLPAEQRFVELDSRSVPQHSQRESWARPQPCALEALQSTISRPKAGLDYGHTGSLRGGFVEMSAPQTRTPRARDRDYAHPETVGLILSLPQHMHPRSAAFKTIPRASAAHHWQELRPTSELPGGQPREGAFPSGQRYSVIDQPARDRHQIMVNADRTVHHVMDDRAPSVPRAHEARLFLQRPPAQQRRSDGEIYGTTFGSEGPVHDARLLVSSRPGTVVDDHGRAVGRSQQTNPTDRSRYVLPLERGPLEGAWREPLEVRYRPAHEMPREPREVIVLSSSPAHGPYAHDTRPTTMREPVYQTQPIRYYASGHEGQP